ncbi:MAG: hypothetical protein LUD38_07550 [Parabacteroides sp.]|nr:hypothetical protein [Parabacteroides sp.]
MKTFYFMLVLFFVGLVVTMPSASTMEVVDNPPRIEPYDGSSVASSGYVADATYLGDRAGQIAAVMIGIVVVLAVAYLITRRRRTAAGIPNTFTRNKTRISEALSSARRKHATAKLN